MDRALSTPFVFGLLLIVILTAFYIPFLIDDTSGTRTLSVNQSETEEIQVYHELNATVDSVQGGQNEIDLTLKDTNTRNETSATLGEGVEQTLQLEGENIIINATVVNAATAEITYTYPVDYNWPDAAKTIVDNLAIIIMGLVLFLLIGIMIAEV